MAIFQQEFQITSDGLFGILKLHMGSPDFTLPLVAMAEIERAVVVVTDTASAMITKPNTKKRNKLGLSIL